MRNKDLIRLTEWTLLLAISVMASVKSRMTAMSTSYISDMKFLYQQISKVLDMHWNSIKILV